LTDEFTEAFSDFCANNGIVSEFIRFDPNRKNQNRFDALEPMYNRETIYVDLTKTTSTIWKEFEKRNRNAIRQARQTNLVVEPTSDPSDLELFYDIYTSAMEAKDASDHYRFPCRFFRTLLNSDISTMIVARYDNEVVGGSVVVHNDHIAYDYLRASNPNYWDLRVNNLLCYEAMMCMRKQGINRFDFQGGRPGVFRFKKGFSTEGREEFHIGKRIHCPEVYESLTQAATNIGIDTDTGYFPAYREVKSN
jgi:lipid II:glycine glycyltransferase (peptidoglycan interpeptide bridge formation enzyme)